jgi:hypothetical protein
MDYRNAQTKPLGYSNVEPTPPPVESPSRLRDLVSNTEQLLSGIHETLVMLEKRLDTVLSPASPVGSGGGTAVNKALSSHLVGRIDILNDGLTDAIHRIQDITQRVEV